MHFDLQIRTYEEEADEDELSILDAPCIKHIIEYSGVELSQAKEDLEILETRRRHIRRESQCDIFTCSYFATEN